MELDNFQSDEFLPPLSRWLTLGGLFLAGTFGALVALASVIKYNPTVKAVAIARPAGEVRIVQAATEGKVESIEARENQEVEEGEAIARIDSSALWRQKNHLEDNIKQCQVELQQINEQLKAIEAQILASLEMLGFYPEIYLNNANSSTNEQSVEIEKALVELSRSMPNLAQELGKERRELLIKRTELIKDLTNGNKELYQLGLKLDNSAIRSPIDGTILQLNLRNPGQVVEVGSAIATIVPRDVPLVFKARVEVADIGRVRVGQKVQIRVSAYPFPDYGILNGTVTSISPDAFTPGNIVNGGGEVYYEATIRPEKSFFLESDRAYPLQSGMEARADIISSEETVLTFFLRKARLIVDR